MMNSRTKDICAVLNDRFRYRCFRCDTATPLEPDFHCPSCTEPRALEATASPDAVIFASTPLSLWHYRDLLPIANAEAIISMREGATPLVQAQRLHEAHAFEAVSFKCEMLNPTGSFKDRQITVGISHARECGYDTVASVSSGNVACATAAYAARAGMKAILFMHGQAGAAKLAQAAVYGATVLQVDDPSAKGVFDLCIEACQQFGWYHLSTAGIYNPFNVEGAKTIAYELYQQYEGDLPEWIVAPVGGGGLLGGIWRGFRDLQRLGLVKTIPRLVGVQPTGCAPLEYAMREGQTFLESLKTPWLNPKSVAGGLADDILFDGHSVLPALRTTDGMALAVTDEAICAAEHRLARAEGVFCEPCSAVTIAALDALAPLARDARVCCILTGSGMKDMAVVADMPRTVYSIPADIEAVHDLMRDKNA